MVEVESSRAVEEETKNEWTLLSLFVLIILLCFIFELARGVLMRRFKNDHEMLNMLNALFNELSVLGFVGLVAMILVKSGVMDSLSNLILGDTGESTGGVNVEEETESDLNLGEMFETVHIFIFFVMFCYIVLVIVLLFTAASTEKRFQDAEKVESKALLLDLQKHWYNPLKRITNVEKIQYRILRKEFFRPSVGQTLAGCKPSKFNFSKYLGICMADFIVELIEIPPTTWFLMMGLVCCIKPFMGLRGADLMTFLLFCSWTLLLMLASFTWITGNAYRLCLPEHCPSLWEPNPTSGDKGKKSTTPLFYTFQPQKAASSFEALIRGTDCPMKQELCFTLWRNGPVLATFLIRVQVFCQSIFYAAYFNLIYSQPHLFMQHVYSCTLQWVPFFVGLLLLWPRLLMYYIVVRNTGMMRNESAMRRTLIHRMQASLNQYTALIYELNTHALIHHIISMSETEYFCHMTSCEANFDTLNQEEQDHMIQGFSLNDADNSGLLNEEEFAGFLRSVMGMNQGNSCRVAYNWYRSGVFRTEASCHGLRVNSHALKPARTSHVAKRMTVFLGDPAEREGYSQVPSDDCETSDSVTLSQFKALVVLLRQLEATGVDQTYLREFVESLCGGRGETLSINTDDFLNVQPLRSAAVFSGICTESEIDALFFDISSPEKEDAVVKEIKFEELATWIRSLREVAHTHSHDD